MPSGVAARLLLSVAALPGADIGARFREAQMEGTFVLFDGQSGEIRRCCATSD